VAREVAMHHSYRVVGGPHVVRSHEVLKFVHPRISPLTVLMY
jgi:hypothetical protein